MARTSRKKLLKDPKIVDEINRYKWIESEKAGYDIGFEQASENWINQYAEKWEEEHPVRDVKKTHAKGKFSALMSGKKSRQIWSF